MKVRLLIFNNKGFPKRSRKAVNLDDYKVLEAKPDVVMEQERWFTSQWRGFKVIFSLARGFLTHRPKTSAVAGLIQAHNTKLFTRISAFSYYGHSALSGICNYRTYAGEVLKINKTNRTLTYINVHPTPSAWGSRFPEGSLRKKLARRAWYKYMNRVKAFALRQLQGGRDYVVIGGDFNAKLDVLVEYFGTKLAGKTVRIYTSPWNHEIDHIIVIGNVKKYLQDTVDTVTSDHRPFYVDLEFL